MVKLISFDSSTLFSVYVLDSFSGRDYDIVGKKPGEFGQKETEVENYEFRFGDMLLDLETGDSKILKSNGWVDC